MNLAYSKILSGKKTFPNPEKKKSSATCAEMFAILQEFLGYVLDQDLASVNQ